MKIVSFITEIFTAASHYVSTRNESVPLISSSRTSANVFLTSLDDGLKVALFKKLCNGVHFGAQQRDARAEVNL